MTIQYTPNFAFPFPQLADSADAPRDIAALASALDTFLKGLVPIGAMAMWATVNAPGGWVLCQGQELDQVGTYAALYAVLGSTYNIAGVGVGKFNVPNLQGNVPVGAGSGYALAQKGGASTVALSAAQIPAHAHGPGTLVTDTEPVHGHNMSSSNAGGPAVAVVTGGIAVSHGGVAINGPAVQRGGDAGFYGRFGVDPGGAHAHAVNGGSTANNTGGGGSHSNLQPYQVVNYIMKYQ